MRGRRGKHRSNGAPCLIVVLLLFLGCSDGSESPAPATADPGASEVEATPTTVISLSDLEEQSDREIDSLLAYYEGGDNACSGVEEGTILDEPMIVDAAFRESEDIQIGWDYSLCWNTYGVDSVELIAPNGEAVYQGSFLPALPPGSPIGTYTAIGTYEGRRLEAEIEVVPAREPRLLIDPELGGRYTVVECSDELRTYLVGFTDVDEVEVAIYDWRSPQQIPQGDWDLMVAELLGTVSVPVDDAGSASLVLQTRHDEVDGRLTLVADPVSAVERWGTGQPPPREDVMELDFNQQLAVDGCFGTG